MASRAAVRIALFCILCTLAWPGSTAEPVYTPAAVKAAFLHRFASYVEWPDAAASAEPFTVGVAGADEVAEQLERLLPDLKIRNRRAQLRRVAGPDELAGIHILYVGPDSAARNRALLQAAAKLPILTVTDDVDGLRTGSVINFVQVGNNIRFEVSLPAAARSGLRIDSGLLSVAARVEERPRASIAPRKMYFAHTKDGPPRHRDRGRS